MELAESLDPAHLFPFVRDSAEHAAWARRVCRAIADDSADAVRRALAAPCCAAHAGHEEARLSAAALAHAVDSDAPAALAALLAQWAAAPPARRARLRDGDDLLERALAARCGRATYDALHRHTSLLYGDEAQARAALVRLARAAVSANDIEVRAFLVETVARVRVGAGDLDDDEFAPAHDDRGASQEDEGDSADAEEDTQDREFVAAADEAEPRGVVVVSAWLDGGEEEEADVDFALAEDASGDDAYERYRGDEPCSVPSAHEDWVREDWVPPPAHDCDSGGDDDSASCPPSDDDDDDGEEERGDGDAAHADGGAAALDRKRGRDDAPAAAQPAAKRARRACAPIVLLEPSDDDISDADDGCNPTRPVVDFGAAPPPALLRAAPPAAAAARRRAAPPPAGAAASPNGRVLRQVVEHRSGLRGYRFRVVWDDAPPGAAPSRDWPSLAALVVVAPPSSGEHVYPAALRAYLDAQSAPLRASVAAALDALARGRAPPPVPAPDPTRPVVVD